MKYIIILLTSLFLVSNASAEEGFNTMKDVCKHWEDEVIATSNRLAYAWNKDTGKVQPAYPSDIKHRVETAKLFHYMDCRTLMNED